MSACSEDTATSFSSPESAQNAGYSEAVNRLVWHRATPTSGFNSGVVCPVELGAQQPAPNDKKDEEEEESGIPSFEDSNCEDVNVADGEQKNDADGEQLNDVGGGEEDDADKDQLNDADGEEINNTDRKQVRETVGELVNYTDRDNVNDVHGKQINSADGKHVVAGKQVNDDDDGNWRNTVTSSSPSRLSVHKEGGEAGNDDENCEGEYSGSTTECSENESHQEMDTDHEQSQNEGGNLREGGTRQKGQSANASEKVEVSADRIQRPVENHSTVDEKIPHEGASGMDYNENQLEEIRDREIVNKVMDLLECSVNEGNWSARGDVVHNRDYENFSNPKDGTVSISSLRSTLSTALKRNAQSVRNTFRCSECPSGFPTASALQGHVINCHKNKCSAFSDATRVQRKGRERLKRSNVVYSRTKPFQCSKCQSSFYEKSELKAHSLAHSKDKRLKCSICGHSFAKRKDLNEHVLSHNKKPAVCEICGKTFSQAGNMKIHLRIHTKEKPYACEHCGKSYAQSGDLKTHIRVHTDERPYLCEFCGNLFHSLSHLARHSKVHTKEKPYTCKVCGNSFAHTHHLKKHYRIHTQEKPYNCEICDKAFSRADYLKQHIRVHTKEKPYICRICGKGFSQGGSLKLHQRVHARQGILYSQ